MVARSSGWILVTIHGKEILVIIHGKRDEATFGASRAGGEGL